MQNLSSPEASSGQFKRSRPTIRSDANAEKTFLSRDREPIIEMDDSPSERFFGSRKGA